MAFTGIMFAIALISIIVVGASEWACYTTYNGYMPARRRNQYMDLVAGVDYYLNTLDSSILSLTGMGYISSIGLSVFCKYHVRGNGMVPRWSKLHRRIKEYYREAEKL